MRRILIPTDYSQNAANAVQYACQLFKQEPVTLHLVHIRTSYQIPHDDHLHTAGFVSLTKKNTDHHDAMAVVVTNARAKNCQKEHHFKTSIIQGRFIESLRDYVKTHRIDLIVMGTKGASGIKEMTIGSCTGAVLTKVKCPTLVIPENAVYSAPCHIGFLTDFNIPYSMKMLRPLLQLADSYRSSINVLRVAQNDHPLNSFQNKNRGDLKQHLTKTHHSFHVVEDPNLDAALQTFISSFKIDVVVMIAKSLNLFQRILFKPRVKKISYHTRIPFLVLHE